VVQNQRLSADDNWDLLAIVIVLARESPARSAGLLLLGGGELVSTVGGQSTKLSSLVSEPLRLALYFPEAALRMLHTAEFVHLLLVRTTRVNQPCSYFRGTLRWRERWLKESCAQN
jgi:hypothetical protein